MAVYREYLLGNIGLAGMSLRVREGTDYYWNGPRDYA